MPALRQEVARPLHTGPTTSQSRVFGIATS